MACIAADADGLAPGAFAGIGKTRWRHRYDKLAQALPMIAANARPVFVGFSAFVDASVRLHEATALFEEDVPEPAKALAGELLARVRKGIGGELVCRWPAGDSWLSAVLDYRIGAGGTSLQIANSLAPQGVPVLLALADRSVSQMDVVAPDVLLAGSDRVRPAREVIADGTPGKARHWIFEATAGTVVAAVSVIRSTRVIVRLTDDKPERDLLFDTHIRREAARYSAASLSSLGSTPDALIKDVFAYVGEQAASWRQSGMSTIHLELADYGPRKAMAAALLSALLGSVTSVGMSLSEWKIFGSAEDLALGMRQFADRWRLDRVCVHADEWACAVTRFPVDQERLALMTGSLLAAARAEAGHPVIPQACPANTTFADDVPDQPLGGGWYAIRCPSPYLPAPRSTVGMGDTFVAGCLLIWSQSASTPATIDLQGLLS